MDDIAYFIQSMLLLALMAGCAIFLWAQIAGYSAIKTPCTELPGYCDCPATPRTTP